MTPNKEDYLKEIGKLGGGDNLVSNKRIAESMRVSPASVSEMLSKMEKEGLVQCEPYRGIRLTQEGKRYSAALLRSHRLWEVFLRRDLHCSWSEAHEDAERLEHVTSPQLAQRLDDFLNYPGYCPHGSAIPRADGELRQPSLRKLNRMAVGESSVIRRVSEEKELLDYLEDLGIGIGDAFTVRSYGACEGPVTLEIGGRSVSVSYKAACHIDVDAS